MALWDYGGNEPTFNYLFNEAMASDARLVASVLVTNCKGVFDGVKSLVDVGGGTGTGDKDIVDAFPHMQCTVLDRPHGILTPNSSVSVFREIMSKSFDRPHAFPHMQCTALDRPHGIFV